MRPPLLLVALLALAACGGGSSDTGTGTSTDTVTPADTDGLVGPHDGSFRATMHRGGGHFALGTIDVVRNVATGTFLSGSGATVHVEGTVAADGTIAVRSLTNDAGLDIVVDSAAITRGVLEARYHVGSDEGVLVGTKDGALLEQAPSRAYDGLYEVAFIRDDEEVAATTMDVKAGAFTTSITAEDGTRFDVRGFVTEDGSVVINEASGAAAIVMAEASLDQETFDIEGIYRAGDRVGRLHGRRAD